LTKKKKKKGDFNGNQESGHIGTTIVNVNFARSCLSVISRSLILQLVEEGEFQLFFLLLNKVLIGA